MPAPADGATDAPAAPPATVAQRRLLTLREALEEAVREAINGARTMVVGTRAIRHGGGVRRRGALISPRLPKLALIRAAKVAIVLFSGPLLMTRRGGADEFSMGFKER